MVPTTSSGSRCLLEGAQQSQAWWYGHTCLCRTIDQLRQVGLTVWHGQERPEDVPTGELPRSMQLLVDRRMVGTKAPGTRITAVGVYAIVQVGTPLQKPELMAVGILVAAPGAPPLVGRDCD